MSKELEKLKKKYNISCYKRLPDWILKKYNNHTLTNDEYEIMRDHAECLIDYDFPNPSLLTEEEKELWEIEMDAASTAYEGFF